MSDEMINKSKPYNKSSGQPGIGDTVKEMNEYDMNVMSDSIAGSSSQSGKRNKSS